MPKTKVLTGVLINPSEQTFDVVRIKDELEQFYKLLGCRCIDIQTRCFNGKKFAIVLDDEGLFIEDNKPAVVTTNNNKIVEIIVGKCLIVNGNGRNGELETLMHGDIEKILLCQANIKDINGNYLRVLKATI